MRTFRTIIAAMTLLVCTMSASAQPMSYYAMRDNARFLTDRMAYTLGITSLAIIDDLYRINYDYICGVNDYLDDVALGYRYDDYMSVMYARDRALQILLGDRIWRRLMTYDYFYRPITFIDRRWSFGIYVHDPYRTRFYYNPPRHYADYRGGHFFHGMPPAPHGASHRPNAVPPPHRYGNGGFRISPDRPNGPTNNRPNGNRPENDRVNNRPDNRPHNDRPDNVRPDNKPDNNHGYTRPANGNGGRGGRSDSNVRSSSRSSQSGANSTRTSASQSRTRNSSGAQSGGTRSGSGTTRSGRR